VLPERGTSTPCTEVPQRRWVGKRSKKNFLGEAVTLKDDPRTGPQGGRACPTEKIAPETTETWGEELGAPTLANGSRRIESALDDWGAPSE